VGEEVGPAVVGEMVGPAVGELDNLHRVPSTCWPRALAL
jgi:hypothetical protein